MSRRDEDGLSWGGDDDPTLDTGRGPAATEPEVRREPRGRPSRGAVHPALAGAPDPQGLGTAALVFVGVFGGAYLLFAVGWVIGGLRVQARFPVLATDVMFQGSIVLAAAAPLLWFATTIFATRTARVWVRWVWLVTGVILLVPWPFLMVGSVR